MFFLRMIGQSLHHQMGRRALIALTVCLSAAVSVTMLGVVFDVGDKLNAELSAYGSNIIVQPKSQAVVSNLYGSTAQSADSTEFLDESDAINIKTIFWSYNITAFAPELHRHLQVTATDGQSAASVETVGTWFHKTVQSATGESTTTGVKDMRSWWKVDGEWASDDADEAMVGSALAQQLGVTVGGSITLSGDAAGSASSSRTLRVVGIYESGDDDETAVYAPSAVVQGVAGLAGDVDQIEVKALTTPDNDLARRAAKDPLGLSQEDWETWYCTAYASSIAYQIEEVIPGAVAKQVRQVQALEGTVLGKTQAVMIVMTVMTLIAAVIAVANLMAASIAERSSQLALLKAVGARNGGVCRLVLGETAAVSVIGAVAGAGIGSAMAQLIGHVVFGTSISMRPMVFVLVAVLLTVAVLVASVASLASILKLHPAEVLHDR